MRYFCLQVPQLMCRFQACLDTCLDSPSLGQPLNSRFALHGLHAFERWSPRGTQKTFERYTGNEERERAITKCFPKLQTPISGAVPQAILDTPCLRIELIQRARSNCQRLLGCAKWKVRCTSEKQCLTLFPNSILTFSQKESGPKKP